MSNSNSIKSLSGGPLRSNVPGLYVIVVECEINGTSVVSTTPTNGKQVTVAHAGTAGDYTITFAGDLKPRRVICGRVAIEEDLPLESAKWTGYTASTGVGTFTMYDGATEAATNFVGTCQLVLFCSKSVRSDA